LPKETDLSGAIPYPPRCSGCELDEPPADHWLWAKDARYVAGGKWRCRVKKREDGLRSKKRRLADPVRGPEMREYARQYAKDHARWIRYKAYRHTDNKRHGGGTIPWDDARDLMGRPCHYCGLEVSEGLDRRDSSRGHTADNVVPCCSACNHILGDIPAELKDELAEGLRRGRAKGLMSKWTPPQFRR
jgi:hypothetical protein